MKEEELSEMVQKLYSTEVLDQLTAAKHIQKWVSVKFNAPILNTLVHSGTVPRFVEFLQVEEHTALQAKAAWTLINIAAGSSQHTKTIIDAGAVPILIKLLQCDNEELRDCAVWVLGNIAGDCPEYRDLLLDEGILEPLLKLLHQQTQLRMIRNVVWAMKNLCLDKISRPDFVKISLCLPAFAELLNHEDCDILINTCWSLCYVAGKFGNKIQPLIDAGVCDKLVPLLRHNRVGVVNAALRVVGIIALGDDTQTQALVNNSVVPSLLYLLDYPWPPIRKDSCWVISNITAGNHTQIQAVIDANGIQTLIDIVNKSENRMRQDVTWALANAASGATSKQARYLVGQGCIPFLCDLFTITDSKTIQVALNGLENILRLGEGVAAAKNGGVNPYAVLAEKCFGMDKIQFLHTHENAICQRVIEVVTKYCNGVNVDEPMEE